MCIRDRYYWLLYYSFLSPQQLKNVEEIIENLRLHIRDISFRTYYRKRREVRHTRSFHVTGVQTCALPIYEKIC